MCLMTDEDDEDEAPKKRKKKPKAQKHYGSGLAGVPGTVESQRVPR